MREKAAAEEEQEEQKKPASSIRHKLEQILRYEKPELKEQKKK